MDIKNHCTVTNDFMTYEKYLLEILKSEAKMLECMQKLFCDSFVEDLMCVEPIEKRVQLIRSIICAYASKENAMAKLIMSLKLPPARYLQSRCCNHQCNKLRQNKRMY